MKPVPPTESPRRREYSDRTFCQIQVREQLDPKFSDWFGGLTISHTPEGDSLLTGVVIDQAALYGILARCRDLGLTLISLRTLHWVEDGNE